MTAFRITIEELDDHDAVQRLSLTLDHLDRAAIEHALAAVLPASRPRKTRADKGKSRDATTGDLI